MKFRRYFPAFFLCFAICIVSFAQEIISVPFQNTLVFPSGVNPMIIWGIRNESGFHEGFALVKSEGKWGAIDKTGKIIIQPQFDQVEDFIEGLKLVKLDDKAEFTDKTGKIVIQPQLEWIQNTIDILKLVELNTESGDIVRNFVDVLTLAELGRESGVIDKTNKIAIQPQLEWIKDFIDILALVELGRKLEFIDETDQIIIQPQVKDFTEGLAPVKSDNKWGFVDKTGKIVIQPQFDSVRNFTEGLAPVELDGKWGFIDKTGKFLTYDGIEEKPELIGDINGDGAVDIFDLVMVAGQFEEKGNNLLGDVNGDKDVNIFDLVMVAGNFGQGKVIAAPTMVKEIGLTINQKRNIETLVDQLESKYNLSSSEKTVLSLLRVVLTKQLPKKTQLLPNYPNPFNPETWIPFELHQNTNVSLTISDLKGNQVRRIDLGYTLLGKYTSHDKAIHWDGKNNNGEKVASGTYFYAIHTNNYTQTKKMVILK